MYNLAIKEFDPLFDRTKVIGQNAYASVRLYKDLAERYSFRHHRMVVAYRRIIRSCIDSDRQWAAETAAKFGFSSLEALYYSARLQYNSESLLIGNRRLPT